MAIVLDIKYTEAQYDVFFGCMHRFRIVQKGGRVGFTQGAAQFIIQSMIESPTPKAFLWGDVTLGNVRKYWDQYFFPVLRKIGREGKAWRINRVGMELHLGKCVCHFRSADNPGNWEGFGYHFIFLNEAGLILKNAYIWEQAVHKTLLDHPNSVMVAAGVPKGLNTFSEMIQWAQDPKMKDWKHFHFSTYANPFISEKAIDDYVRDSPDMARQEIYGEVVGADDNPLQFIKSEWVDMAFERYAILQQDPQFRRPALSSVGGDPSRGGDECCLTPKFGNVVDAQMILRGEDASTTQKVANAWEITIRTWAGNLAASQVTIPIMIDYVGWGSGVYDLLAAKFKGAVPLTGGGAVSKKDWRGQYELANEVTWWWWSLREKLDPNSKNFIPIAICPDPIVRQQLCAPRYEIRGTTIYREKKELTKKRLGGQSPDRGESVVYACCEKSKPTKLAYR